MAADGNHIFAGGAGDDIYYVWYTSDTVVEHPDAGIDTVYSTLFNYTLPDNVENLVLDGNWYGNATGTGNALDNIIVANAANQTMDGGAGNDVLVGNVATTFIIEKGNGSDTIYNFNSGDIIRLSGYGITSLDQAKAAAAQIGSDTVFSFANGEKLILDHVQLGSLAATNFQLAIDTSKLQIGFADEFNSFSRQADGGTWLNEYRYGGIGTISSHTMNNESEIYMDPEFAGTSDHALGVDPFSIKDGVLSITAAPTSPDMMSDVANHSYTSGLITSINTYSQEYGYFEARVAMPAGQGFWPAFWLLPADDTWPPEIDIFEQLGKDPNTVYLSNHYVNADGSFGSFSDAEHLDTTQFHTYGVDWTATTLTYYIDGIAVATQATPDGFNKEAYILANLAVGGGWSGAPDATTGTGAMQIDYIRAYLTPDTVSTTINGVHTTYADGVATVTPIDDGGVALYNHAPYADSDGPYTLDEDGALSVDAAHGLLTGDSDIDGDAMTAVLTSTTAHGTLKLNADGSFDYQPDADFNGTDSFVYVAQDSHGAQSNAVAIKIDVAPVNDAPVARGDGGYTAAYQTTTEIHQASLLQNDSDVDGDSLTVAAVGDGVHGTAVLSGWDVLFTPDDGFSGTASFSYTVSDRHGGTDTATVSVLVGQPGNYSPIANADTYTLAQGAPLVVAAADGLLANDRDYDGDAITARLVSPATHGTVTLDGTGDGAFTYTPDAGFAGTDSFVYQASDGILLSRDTFVTLTVDAPAPAPVASTDGDAGGATSAQHDTVTPVADGASAATPDGDATPVAPTVAAPVDTHAADPTPAADPAPVAESTHATADPSSATVPTPVVDPTHAADPTPAADPAPATVSTPVVDPTPVAEAAVQSGPVYVSGPSGDAVIDKSGSLISWMVDARDGDDVIMGGDAGDSLSGGGGNDTIHGGGGNDYISGGKGTDVMWGGGGVNTFIFNAGDLGSAATGGADHIMDFAGAGAWGGDFLDFFGFGPDAKLTLVGDATPGQTTYLYHIDAGANSGDLLIDTGGKPLSADNYCFF